MPPYMIAWVSICSVAAFILLCLLLSGLAFFIGVFRRKPYSVLGSTAHRTEQRLNVVNPARQAAIDSIKDAPFTRLEVVADDGVKLRANLYKTALKSKGLVFCLHGFNSNPLRVYARMVPTFNSLGYDVLLVSARAHADSDGKWCGFSVLDSEDIRAWLMPLSAEYSNVFLYGVSMGAAACALAAGSTLPPQVKGVIFDCGFTSPKDEFQTTVAKKVKHLSVAPLLAFGDLWCRIFAGFSFLDKHASAEEAVKSATVPFLFIHGEDDERVPKAMSDRMFAACASTQKQQVIVKGAEHTACMFIDPALYDKSVTDFIVRNSR